MPVKDKLITSALKIFSKSGYRDGRVADIAKHAKANIASINYYFGSKEALFAEVLRHAFQAAEKKYPADGGLDASASCEEKLAAFARSIIYRTLDPGPAGNFNRIMSLTVKSPGSPTGTICEEVRSLQVMPLAPLLHEFIGETDEVVYQIAALNFLSLSDILAQYPEVVEHIFGKKPDEAFKKTFVDGQVKAVIAATKALAV
ncbi:TetR/AcrR family transcriptional regulator [Rubritalea marina]|uniref:TetR/AcrR family transcriptional regulator n=1 Tax=Rubritalea marina TaxID=361055 RepID=UPI0012E9E641|nr:TetR family transcriptional regulator [Rubritalea marina]